MLGFWKICLCLGTVLASFDLITADKLLFITRQKFFILLTPHLSCWSFSPTQLGVICSCFPGDSDSKESPCNVGDQSSVPESGRSSGEGNDSIQFSHSVMFDSLGPYGLQHSRLPCPSPTPRAYSNSCPWSRWCHPTISFSVIPFSSCLQSFPGSVSFPMSQFFASGGQSSGVSPSASVLPMNIQDWFPLGLTGWVSLQSKVFSRVFFNTKFKSINSSVLNFLYSPTLTSIHDYWKNHILTRRTFVGKVMSLLLSMLSRLVITFLPKCKRLLISWLESPYAVILEPPQIKSVSVSIVSPSICNEVMGLDAMIFVFCMLSFKPGFSLSSFTFIKRL